MASVPASRLGHAAFPLAPDDSTDPAPDHPRGPDDLPKFETVNEVAALLRTSPKAIYSMVGRAELPGVVRIGRRLLFRREALVKWLSEKGGTPSPEGERR